MTSRTLSLAAARDRFFEHLALERHAPPNTVAAYRRDLTQLAHHLEERLGRPPSVEDVHKLALRTWLASLADGRTPRTVSRKLSAVRALFRFLQRTGCVVENPGEALASPKVRRRLPRFLDAEAAERVVRAPTADDGPGGSAPERLRDAAILELLYGSGVRVGELVGLDVERVSIEQATARVIGKGDKERVVPLGRPTCVALAGYLRVRGQLAAPGRPPDAQALFVSRRGRRLGARWVQRLVKRYGALGAGRSDLHPHALRHSCATHMLEGGADLRVIQELLGHASLGTTEQYTHVTLEKLFAVYDRAHPLAKASAPHGDGED